MSHPTGPRGGLGTAVVMALAVACCLGVPLVLTLLTAAGVGLWLQANGYVLLGSPVGVIAIAAGFAVMWRRRRTGS